MLQSAAEQLLGRNEMSASNSGSRPRMLQSAAEQLLGRNRDADGARDSAVLVAIRGRAIARPKRSAEIGGLLAEPRPSNCSAETDCCCPQSFPNS
jgi:hypothetical protein